MKTPNLLFIFAILLCSAFFSCEMKKELTGGIEGPSADGQIPLKDAGLLDLELKPQKEAAIPDTKGGVSGSDVVVLDVNDFAVDILDSIGQVYKHYESYADLKKEGALLLPAGSYFVRATMGEDVNAGFDTPFYSGTNKCKITPQEVAKVITDCVLSNKKVVFRCSDKFLADFEDDYSIVVNNGNGALTTFKNEKRATYLKSTGVLQFTIYTTMRNGKKDQVYSIDLSKNTDVQEHNNILIDLSIVEDSPGTGGDDPDKPEKPVDPVEPEDPGDPEEPENPNIPVKAPTIQVDISLIEKDYIIEIPSDFVDSGDTGGGGGGDKPIVAKPTVTATLDGNSFDISTTQSITGTSKVVILLTASSGLESLKVNVNIGGDKLDLDLFNLDPVIAGILAGQSLPEKGKKGTQKFDITPFVEMLVPGINTFKISLTDAKGESGGGTITLNKQ